MCRYLEPENLFDVSIHNHRFFYLQNNVQFFFGDGMRRKDAFHRQLEEELYDLVLGWIGFRAFRFMHISSSVKVQMPYPATEWECRSKKTSEANSEPGSNGPF
jgi:hypothetical protein